MAYLNKVWFTQYKIDVTEYETWNNITMTISTTRHSSKNPHQFLHQKGPCQDHHQVPRGLHQSQSITRPIQKGPYQNPTSNGTLWLYVLMDVSKELLGYFEFIQYCKQVIFDDSYSEGCTWTRLYMENVMHDFFWCSSYEYHTWCFYLVARVFLLGRTQHCTHFRSLVLQVPLRCSSSFFAIFCPSIHYITNYSL